MGNASTRETSSPYQQGHSRSASSSSRYRSGSANDARSSNPLLGGSVGNGGSGGGSAYSSRRDRDRERDTERARNLEHALFGLGLMTGSSRAERTSRTREEEREAREARKAEKEKEKERERQRSLREESCDGGFLVTQGVYTGIQDFKDKVVRHFMLERKLAPFWKGLPDHDASWTEAQLVAAARGLPVPGPDVQYEPEPPPMTPPSLGATSAPNISDSAIHLMVPIGNRSRSHSYTSDSSGKSGNTSALSVPRTRSRTLTFSSPVDPVLVASATNPLETNITGQYIDGRPVEAVLYKNAAECPICFLYYPPFMNKTRCCDYDICSECFVQIKRADPHLPHDEQHLLGGTQEPVNPDLLISEPASCPFCKEQDFGVVYSPPPFRRGLVYTESLSPSCLGSSAHSPDPSIPLSPPSPPQGSGPRRKMALSSSAPEVVTTDQIRPDWAHKLQSARNHAARRAAAATAIHNAAFLLNTQRESGGAGGGSSGGFASRRLMRRGNITHGSESPSPGGSGAGTPRVGGERLAESLGVAGLGLLGIGSNGGSLRSGSGSGADAGGGRRRARMADLEEMMLREAIRLSILEEEARKAKEEAETKKKEDVEKPRAVSGEEVVALVDSSGEGSGNGKGKAVDRSAHGQAFGDAAESSASILTDELEGRLKLQDEGAVIGVQTEIGATSGDVKKAEVGLPVDMGKLGATR